MTHKIGDTWFRLRDQRYAAPLNEYDEPVGSGSFVVHCDEFEVVKVTPCGVWLSSKYGTYLGSDRRFVLNRARKRFACPTKDDALVSFIARKTKQAGIYRARMEEAERAIKVATGTPVWMT